jgi:hypothetical protein
MNTGNVLGVIVRILLMNLIWKRLTMTIEKDQILVEPYTPQLHGEKNKCEWVVSFRILSLDYIHHKARDIAMQLGPKWFGHNDNYTYTYFCRN